jgi:putative FmdB family regulatory protein
VPTYEYACKQCGEHLEVVQSFKDDPLTTCPQCGGELRKVFGAIGISFKGSGFYRNDSRPREKASTGRSSSTDGSSTSDTASSDTGSSDKAPSDKGSPDKASSSSGSSTSSGSDSSKAAS